MHFHKAIVVIACVLTAGCSGNNDLATSNESAVASASSTASAASVAQAKASLALAEKFDPARPFSEWFYSSKTDPMTDEVIWSARLSSKETFDLDFPYNGRQSATLYLRTGHNGQREVMLFIDKGQIICHDSAYGTGCPIKVRFDEGEVETVGGSGSTDNDPKVVFFPRGTLDRILESKKFRVSVTLFQAGDHALTFDTSTLDPAKLGPTPIVQAAQ